MVKRHLPTSTSKRSIQSFMTNEMEVTEEITLQECEESRTKMKPGRFASRGMDRYGKIKKAIRFDPSAVREIDGEELEAKAISCFRIFILLVMFCVTVGGVVQTWVFFEQQEDSNFQSDLDLLVDDIRFRSEERVSTLVADSQSLSLTLTALAKNAKAEWPYCTASDFPIVASNFMRRTGAHLVVFSPIVQNRTEFSKWSNYSQGNQKWIEAGVEFQEEIEPIIFGEKANHLHQHHHHDGDEHEAVPEIFPEIFRIAEGTAVVDDGPGPFLPSWQMAEAPLDPSVVNFNLLSDSHFADVFDAVLRTNSPRLGDLLGQSFPEWEELLSRGHNHGHTDTPFNLLLCPVHRDDSSEEVVGMLMSDINWLPLFALSSEEETSPVLVVVDEGCERKFTLQVAGSNVDFVGFDDFHESEFDVYKRSFPFSSDLASVHMAGPQCSYTVHVYPSREFWDAYHTNYPEITAMIVAGVFLTMGFILYLYDLVVNVRQRRIVQVASRSEQMLSVLYPKNIRDRLFGLDSTAAVETERPVERSTKGSSGYELRGSKHKLRNFLGSSIPVAQQHNGKGDKVGFDSKPIADLFLDTTVFFADIAGFTSWSSVREPTQVFTLLESVYHAFDVIAKKKHVFKVETVGDSYVAVTGLPEPTEDHARIMAEFARECVARFDQLVGTLEISLGPDTGDLGIRVGMHSGPVTAGVLRGDKSRFQLFGDTVNTASRIESTGKRDKIQVSQETAHLLIEAGKADWLRERVGKVSAKGKGSLQTYWLLTEKEEEHLTTLAKGATEESFRGLLPKPLPTTIFRSGEQFSASSFANVEKALSPRLKRLCQWNCAVLTRLLKQIVAHRNASRRPKHDSEEALSRLEAQIRQDHVVLDELVDVIALPGFDPVVYQRMKNPEDVVLSKEVEDQIRLFVVCIASMYHDNPFHNFDHASHVTMSVSKLLSRIVGVDGILDSDKAAVESKDFGWSIHDHTYGITSDPMTHFSVVLAALVHDVDHLGVSNTQLVTEGHELAGHYENRSVAEQNSTVLSWELLMDSRFDAFRRTIYADQFELKRFRQLMANTVLATDIMDKELQLQRRNRWNCAFSVAESQNLGSARENVNRKATIVIEHLIQASDVSHTMQHWHIYCKWNERLFEEMSVAYKAGRLGFNPADTWYEGELGFFDNYVIPLAKKLKDCGVFGVSSDEYLNYAMENREEWEEKGREVVAEMIERYHSD